LSPPFQFAVADLFMFSPRLTNAEVNHEPAPVPGRPVGDRFLPSDGRG
jgi:hypothetical protein